MEPEEITQLLQRWGEGDEQALDELFPLVYDDLHRLAQHFLGGERSGHTLQPTALVHEAYLKLVEQENPSWQNRTHFYAVAGLVMRRILVDYARQRAADKRGGGAIRVTFEETLHQTEEKAADLVALDDALKVLAKVDPRKSRIIELRFFAGLALDETAELLGISVPTVVREARVARVWLYNRIAANPSHENSQPLTD